MMLTPKAPSETHNERWRVAARVNLSYWAVIYILLTLRSFIADRPNQLELGVLRVSNVAVGALLCFGIWAGLERMASRSYLSRFVAGWVMMLLASFAFSNWMNLIYHFLVEDIRIALDQTAISVLPKGQKYFLAGYIMMDTLEWLPMFLAWGGFSFGLLYNLELQERDRLVAQLQTLSYEAQLRALRYQVDPHFLFNSFNTISALVLARKNDLAEALLLRLASYFRKTLTLDSTEDVRLDAEIDLQQTYLEIEQLRFPDELQVEINVSPDLGRALVPSLILQPLVENAVKYGLHREPVRPLLLRIEAQRHDGWLVIEVSDNGGASDVAMPSTGTGLRNVKERLIARYGAQHQFEAGPVAGGYKVRMRMPYRTA